MGGGIWSIRGEIGLLVRYWAVWDGDWLERKSVLHMGSYGDGHLSGYQIEVLRGMGYAGFGQRVLVT